MLGVMAPVFKRDDSVTSGNLAIDKGIRGKDVEADFSVDIRDPDEPRALLWDKSATGCARCANTSDR